MRSVKMAINTQFNDVQMQTIEKMTKNILCKAECSVFDVQRLCPARF